MLYIFIFQHNLFDGINKNTNRVHIMKCYPAIVPIGYYTLENGILLLTIYQSFCLRVCMSTFLHYCDEMV